MTSGSGPPRVGPFAVGELLGVGGMAKVFAVEHTRTGAQLALKVLDPQASAHSSARAQLESEVQAAARLTHPGIVRVLDSGIVGEGEARPREGFPPGAAWLAMERLDGGTLATKVGEAPSGTAVVRWMRQLLGALEHAHARDVLHRDVKPSNLLLDHRGRVRLTDFGIAHVGGMAGLTSRRQGTGGSPLYMGPEVFDDSGALGPWTDLYAVGCVAYELLEGRSPFVSPNLFALIRAHVIEPVPALTRTDLPPGLEDWVLRLLEKAPRDRFQRAADAARALDVPTGAIPDLAPLPAERPLDPRPRSSSGLGLVGVRPIPITGRRPERDGLWAALREAYAGVPRGVVLTGPAGVGRSRLASWLSSTAYESGAVVLWASGREQRPLAEAVRRLFRLGPQPDDVRPRLAALIADDDLDWLADATATLVTGDGPVRLESRAEVFALVGRLAERFAGGRPIVAVLEDVVLNANLCAFARWLLDDAASERRPVIVVSTARDGDGRANRSELKLLRRRPDVVTLPMKPLAPRDHLSLIQKLLGLERSLAVRLAQRTRGRPWFAAEIVADWVRQGALREGTDGYVLARAVPLPDGLHEHWNQRIERALRGLPSSDAAALELLGLGQGAGEETIWLDACESARAVPSGELVPRLLRLNLLRSMASGRRLAHPLLVESLERRAREAGRLQDLHSAWVTAHQRSKLPAAPRLLSWGEHLIDAGLPVDAMSMLGPIADDLVEYADSAKTARFLDLLHRALVESGLPSSDPRWSELGLIRIRTIGHREDLAELERVAQQILTACEGRTEPGEPPSSFPPPWSGDPACFWAIRARALRGLTIAHRDRGEHAQALELLVEVERWARLAHDDKCMVAVYGSRGHSLHFMGNPEAAVAEFDKFHSLAVRVGDLRSSIVAKESRAECLGRLGRIAEARADLDECARKARAAGYQRTLASVLLTMGSIEGGAETVRPWAESALKEAALIYRREGARVKLATTQNSLGDLARLRGDAAGAEALYREAEQLYLRTDATFEWLPPLNLAILFAQMQRWDESLRSLTKARPLILAHGWAWYNELCDAVQATAYAGQGDWAAFETVAAGLTKKMLEPKQFERDAAWALYRAAEFALAADRPEAHRLLRGALAHYEGLADAGWIARCEALLAR